MTRDQWWCLVRRAFRIPDVVGDELAVAVMLDMIKPTSTAPTPTIAPAGLNEAAAEVLDETLGRLASHDLDGLFLPEEFKGQYRFPDDLPRVQNVIVGAIQTQVEIDNQADHEHKGALVLNLLRPLVAFVRDHPYFDEPGDPR